MTDEQINVAVAKACGWTEIHDSGVWHHHKLWGYPPLKPGQGGNSYHYLPNYCTDLNAMHLAEKVLGKKLSAYGELLCEMTVASEEDLPECYIWHKTARQRAEAFLRAIGKWKGASA